MTQREVPEAPRLGFVGLGHIGSGVCANLLADGHDVTVFDLDAARVDAMVSAGAHAAGSVAEVAAAAAWTFVSVPSPEDMESVAEEWLEAALAGDDAVPGDRVLVDLTTNAPSMVRAVGGRLADAGASLVEAPVTGGAPGARNRMLVFIVGGDDASVERVRPLLDSLGRAVCHLGPLGSGNIGKLFNSLMAFTTMWVTLEGLALAAKQDVDLRALVDMVRTSGGATPYVDRRVDEISQRGRAPEFTLDLAAKDAGLMLDAGRQVGAPMPVASALHQMLTFARAQGLGGHDISDLVEVAERAAQVELVLRPPDVPPAG